MAIKCLHCNDEFVPRQKFCCDNCRKRYHEGRKSPGILEERGTEASIHPSQQNQGKLVFNMKKGIYERK